MKITLSQLSPFFDKHPKGLYWISGDDPVMQDLALTEICAKAESAGFIREVHTLETSADWDAFESVSTSLSLFNPKPFYEIRMREFSWNENLANRIKRLIADQSGTLYVLSTPKLEAAMTRTQRFQTIESECYWLALWPPQGAALTTFLKSMITRTQLHFTPEALSAFLKDIPDLLSAQQTLARLSLSPHSPIDLDTLKKALPDVLNAELFELTDRALAGNPAETARHFHSLMAQNSPLILILWTLTRDIEALIAVKRNAPVYLPAPRQRLFTSAASRFSLETLLKLFAECARLERVFKGGEIGVLPEQDLLDVYLCLSLTEVLAKN